MGADSHVLCGIRLARPQDGQRLLAAFSCFEHVCTECGPQGVANSARTSAVLRLKEEPVLQCPAGARSGTRRGGHEVSLEGSQGV